MGTSVDFGLAGQVAVVTGGASGIGEAVALGLAAEGATVVVCDVVGDRATAVATSISAAGGRAEALELDVSSFEACESAIAEVVSVHGGVDVLVNSAGVNSFGTAYDESLPSWRRVLDINLDGTFHMLRSALPRMIAARRGAVANIGSSFSARGSVFNADGGSPSYVVSKAGVQALTRKAAFDVAPFGVRVNAVAPGTIDTPMQKDFQDRILAEIPTIPLGRLGAAEDLVGAVLFLCSSAASYVTGQTLHVNGGKIMAD